MTNRDSLTFSAFCDQYQERIEIQLDRYLPAASTLPTHLHAGMRYSVLNGGKRLRPLAVYATGELFGTAPEKLDLPAAAVELIHCYSLVHDDLPAMDDDDLRRGKPSCHKAFGEATAILVGDALQNLAFELLSQPGTDLSAEQQLKMIQTLTQASGSRGMAGGQILDLHAEKDAAQAQDIEIIHTLKTGELITACFQLGAIASGCHDASIHTALEAFGKAIGLAFQIQDDILDIEGHTDTLGKPIGSDTIQEKATYPAAMGLIQAKNKAQQLYNDALAILATLPFNTQRLLELSAWMVKRSS